MNTDKMMISIPFNEWEEINDKIDSYDKLQEKYENPLKELQEKYEKSLKELQSERVNKRFYYRVGTDAQYRVSVTTVSLHEETFEESERFEQMIRESVEREMELRKEYDAEIEELKTRIENMWKIFARTPLWLLRIFGLREKKQK